MPQPIEPRLYQDKVAQGMVGADPASGGGLPAFLDIRVTEAGPARLVAELVVRDDLLNPFGTAHGGVVSALVDHVLGSVLYPHIERGRWAATTTFTINLLSAVRGGTVRAEATIVSMTKRTAVVQVDVTNDGKPVALAQGTVLIPEPA
jgi:1,4-dihydroxy-2-naphthoyl-CoA hydrolase